MREDVRVELVSFDELMGSLTLPLTLRNLLGNFQVLGQTTKNKGTPKIRILRKRTQDNHTRDIPEKDLFPSSTESEAFDFLIRS